jgi:transketolase
MICVFSHTGFQDAADGASHQALCYLSMIGNIPDVDVYALTCSEEAEALMTAAIEKFAADRKAGKVPRSSVFFLGRENFPKNFGNSEHSLTKAQIIKETAGKNSVTIVAAGSMVGEGLKAASELATKGIGSIVVNPVCLNQIDISTFKSVLGKTSGRVLTVEDHQLNGGFSAYFAQAMSLSDTPMSLVSLGVHGEFGQSAYNAIELYQKHGIDSGSIVRNILKKWG